MGNIYSAGFDKNLLLYSSNNNIYLRTAIGENLGRSVLLGNDYHSDLCSIIFNGTIYYSYKNANEDILIRSITDAGALFRIANSETPDSYNPQLINFHNSLLLLYTVKNPLDESFSIKFCFPLEPERHLTFPYSYSDIPTIQYNSIQDSLFLHIRTGYSITTLQITTEDSIHFLIDRDTIIERQKIHYEAELTKKENIIRNIQKQYEELMDTANQYRAEAMKWHDRYYAD